MRSKLCSLFRIVILFAAGIFFFPGCTVHPCDKDNEDPLINVKITGLGHFRDYRSDDPVTRGYFEDYFYLNLHPGITYNFIASINDPCGAELLNIRFDPALTLTELRDVNGTPLTATLIGLYKVVRITEMIDNGNVKTALIITGKFTTPQSVSYSFMNVNGHDYGGSSRSQNSAEVKLGFEIDASLPPGEGERFAPSP